MLDIGQKVGDYEVLVPLGTGGMGCVYKVRNVISNREEAMKILLPDFVSDPQLAARFMAEIRTLAGLEHPGIAQLRTAFQLQNQFVMVMEFVEGTTLETIAVHRKIPLDLLLDYSTQVLAALAYAHSRGVIHRDIKPANIMITSHGLVKLMDFGIAKSTNDDQLTRPGTTMGSMYYMSPEQVRGIGIDGRSDLYSYGVTLYEMLTACKPFYADSSYGVLNAHLNQIPTPPIDVNPTIPRELNDIVLRAMAKRPEERFQTADEFCKALKIRCEPQAATIPAIPTQPKTDPVVPAAAPEQQAAPVAPAPATQAQLVSDTARVHAGLEPAAASPGAAAGPEPATVAHPSMSGSLPPPSPAVIHRGLWIGIGAGTATLALAGVVALLPRVFSTHAGQKPALVAPETPAPASVPVTNPQQTPASAPSVTGPSASHVPISRPPEVQNGHAGEARVSGSEPSVANFDTGRSTQEPREARDARIRFASLQARADSASSGVQKIRSRPGAQGAGTPVEILLARDRMQRFLSEAHRALTERDVPTAHEYMNRADAEITRVEKFLGR